MDKIRVHLEQKHDKKIYDIDIAHSLNLTKEHFSRSKKANKIPLQSIVEFCAKENLVINYILFNQIPDSLSSSTDKIITVKYFKNINSSAGGGAINDEEDYEQLGIDEEVLKQLGGQKKLKFIEAVNVKGDSMEPVIKDGDILFIDKSSNNPCHDKHDVYVVNTPNGILVKVVTLIPHYKKFQLQSYNELYPSELHDCEDISIVGKVVGVSNISFNKGI